MFNPELEVPSLELCKKMKELGFPQTGGGWYWDLILGTPSLKFVDGYEDDYPIYKDGEDFVFKAPTCREMDEYLPLFNVIMFRGFKDFRVYHRKLDRLITDNKPANARAKMLIWLCDNGYVKFEVTE
jgi:hypothetical protein